YRFLVESRLLIRSFVSNIGGLPAGDFYTGSQIGEARFRLLKKGSQPLDVTGERRDLFTNRRCARAALTQQRAMFGECRFIRRQLRRELAFTRLRGRHAILRGVLLRLRSAASALVQRTLCRRQ